jgi:hypothetical protein
MTDGITSLKPGGRLGRYELLEELGRGGMGVVFKARDPAIDRLVAIKTMRLELLAAGEDLPQASMRFAREARAAGQLSHPHIVTLFDAHHEGGLAYLVMEYVAGESLDTMLRARAPFSVERVCAIGMQVCDALEHAHARGVVHRDIKPANLLVRPDGTVKIADFGVAHLARSTLTTAGQALGTPSYMSPEQIEGRPVDGRADLFSLGAVLYELACHEKAFPGDSITTIIYRILHTDPVPLHQLNTLYPPGLDAAIRKALAKDSAARYAGAGEFREALSRVAAGQGARPVEARPAPSPAGAEDGGRRARSHNLLVGGGVAACLAAAALVFWTWPVRAPGPVPPPEGRAPGPPPAPTPAAAPPPHEKGRPTAGPPGQAPGPAVPAKAAAPGEPTAPKVVRLVFAQDVRGMVPVREGDTFYRDDAKVILWVRWANVRGKHTTLAQWFDPEGTLAYAAPAPEPFDAPAEWWTTWTVLDLKRVPRVIPGRWRVEIQLDGQVLGAAHFALLDRPRPAAPATPGS